MALTVSTRHAGRADLMQFLKSECESTGATIVYATHIFDGLESWPTHLMYLANGTLKVSAACVNFRIAPLSRIHQLHLTNALSRLHVD